MKTQWIIHMSLEQVEMLEMIFAYLTNEGWIIPDWLIELREIVELAR